MKRVILSEEALSDLSDIWAFLAERSEDGARATVEAIIVATESLSEFPERCMVMPALQDLAIRRLLMRDWMILFRIGPASVEIARIVHGGRDLASLRLGR